MIIGAKGLLSILSPKKRLLLQKILANIIIGQRFIAAKNNFSKKSRNSSCTSFIFYEC